MSGTSFRVDILLHSLKEIQQEKCCLENKLEEQKRKRRELETTLESVNSKFHQIKDIQEKMQETLKVAQHKVVETQSMANSSEQLNIQIRKNISELNNAVDSEKERQMENVRKFEDQLSEVAEYLCKAKTVYDDKELVLRIQDAETQKLQLEKKVADFIVEHVGLEQALEKLSIDTSKDGNLDKEVPVDVRKDLLSSCKGENQYMKQQLHEANYNLASKKQMLSALEETT